VLSGGASNDVLDAAKGRGKNVLRGDAGNDILFAGRNDNLFGGAGDDVLWAKNGNSTLTGGAGADKFWIPNGSNARITDFQAGTDLLGIIDASKVGQFEDLILTQQGYDTVITFQGKAVTTLVGVSAQTLDQNSFNFVQSEGEALELTSNKDLNGDGTIGSIKLPTPINNQDLNGDGTIGSTKPPTPINDGSSTQQNETKLNYTDVAIAFWNSGSSPDARKLADLLWDQGANPIEIGQAMKYLDLSLETIADSVKWGVTKADETNLDYHQVAEALWSSGYNLDARKLADLLWDNSASQQQIGQAFNYLGLSLETIADSVKRGITKSDGTGLNDIDVAIALWNSGYSFEARKLADLLWDQGANPTEIGQAMQYLGLSLETIADSVKWGITKADETNLDYHQVAEALWNSGYRSTDGLNSRKLADLLWDNSASQEQTGQAFNYLGLSLETIADAVKWGITQTDGTNLNYVDAAIAVWNSGYGLDTRKLADLLWDSGASQQQIGQIFKYFNWNLETIADAIDDGVTNDGGFDLTCIDTALALWNSGYGGADGLNARKLADLLWDEGADQKAIGQAMKYLGLSLEDITDSVKWGITKSDGTDANYTDAAVALWNSGYSGADGLNTRKLADLLWDEGADQKAIGQAMRYLDLSLETIADAMDNGVTKSDGTNLNYNSVAEALWNSGHNIDSRKLADLLWDEGADQKEVGQVMKYLGLSLETIADAMDNGVTKSDGTNLNYIDVAIALWNSGHGFTYRKLADLLWDEGADQKEVGQAMKYLGLSLETIADSIKWGITTSNGSNLNYNSVAEALWNSGYSFNARKLADLLWDEAADQKAIGQAMKYLGLSLETIADSVKWGITKSDGTNLNYNSVAEALWNSGYSFNARKLADLLWDEGADQSTIGQIFTYLGLSLENIADAVKWGVTKSDNTNLNYTDAAIAIWDSGYGFTYRELADLIWDEGASQSQVGQAMKYLGLSLETIADSVKWGITQSNGSNLNWNRVAEALWNSGYRLDSRKLADLLWDEGADQSTIGKTLRYLNMSNEVIADAVKKGVTHNGYYLGYVDAAIAVWNSGNAVSDYRIAVITYSLGGGGGDVYDAIKAIGGTDARASWLSIQAYVKEYIINPFFEAVFGAIPGAAAVVNGISDAGNSIIDSAGQAIDSTADSLQGFYEDNQQVIDLVLLPYTLPTTIVLNTIEAAKQGDVEVIVDGLKRIPVLGTAVGVIDGVIKAAQGDEKGILEESINSALAFYGASNVITPNMVEFAVDIFWELKDSDYQGAISASLENLGMQKTVADLFVTVAWSAAAGSNWESTINAALTKVGFNNANSFVNMAWDIIDKNYKEALKTGLELVGFTNLGINQAKADAFLNLTVAIRDGNPNQAADVLIALSGNNSQVVQSNWIKDLRDGNLANDRQALQLGLSALGFQSATKWVDTIWAVKEEKYLDALSTVMTLGSFVDGQDWVKIIDNLQKEKYVDALSTAFKLAQFQDGQSLADAVLAVKEEDYITAFYESLNLIEGGRDLADAFKYLRDFDLQEFVTSMIGAAPLLLKVLV